MIVLLDERMAREINRDIKKKLRSGKPVKVMDLKGLDCIAAGLNLEGKVFVEGRAGAMFGAFNRSALITLTPTPQGKSAAKGNRAENVGVAGPLVGDTMLSGALVLKGSVGPYCGYNMAGGVILVHGNAETYAGARMRGGALIVKGSIGDLGGWYMAGGDLIVVGNCGTGIGEGMSGGSIYIGGECGAIGKGAEEVEMDEESLSRLETYLRHYRIDAEAGSFIRITSKPHSK